MFEISRQDIGGPGSEKKCYGTHKTQWRMGRCRCYVMINFTESGHPAFRGYPVLLKEEIARAKEKDGRRYFSMAASKWLFVQLFLSISSVSTELWRICVGNEISLGGIQKLKGYGGPGAPENLETMSMPPGMSTTNQASQTDAGVQGNLLRECEQKFADLPEHAQLTKLCSHVALANTVEKGQYFMTLDDDQLDRLNGSCLEYTLHRGDQSSHVKVWVCGNTKIGPVLDVMFCCHQGRYGVETKIESLFGDKTCSWVRIVNGIEWNQRKRDSNVRRESRCKCWREEYRETCCEGQTTTDINFDVVSCVYSAPWTKVDRHRTRKIWQKLSGGVKIVDQIAATWRFDMSRRRRSSKIRRSGINISIEKWVYLALANSDMDKLLAKRRRSKEKVPVLLEPCLTWTFFCSSEQFKAVLEAPLLIPHCKTTYCCQMTSSSTSITLGTLTTNNPSSCLGWFREVKVSGKMDMRCSSQPSARLAPISTKKLSTTWRIPGLQCTRIFGKFTLIQYTGVIWRLLRRKDCSSVRHDPTQSSFTTLYLRYASRKWYTWSQEKNCAI